VVRVGETRSEAEFWWRNFLQNGHLENREVDGRIALRWIVGI